MRLGSLAADSAAGPVGRLGRWAGTTAVAEAPGSFETKQGCGTSTVSREGHPLIIRDPIDPHRADRWDRGFVTKEALCHADPDPWEPWGSNPLGPPGLFPSSLLFSLLPVAGRVVVADHTPGTLEKQGFRDQRATE